MSKKKKKNIPAKTVQPEPKEPKRFLFIGLAVIILLSAIVFSIHYDIKNINPRNTEWLLHLKYGDTMSQYTVWRFFVKEPWMMPLGRIRNYLYPLGTSAAYSDLIPLAAFAAKLITPIAGFEFQYFGLWKLLCYILQGITALLLMRTATSKVPLQILGAVFFLTAPVLLARDHYSLSAQWLILASLWIYFSNLTPWQGMTGHAVLMALTPLIHPYFVGIIGGLAVTYGVRLYFADKAIGFKQAFLYAAGTAFPLLVIAYLLGFISKNENMAGWGFGYYSLNLNALLNTNGPSNNTATSSLFGWLPYGTEGQYEGYSYLGLGLLILLAYSLWLGKKGKRVGSAARTVRLWPIVWAALIYTVFALSNKVYFGKHLVFEYDVSESFMKFAGMFRASGRFFWMPYYLLIYSILRVLFQRGNTYRAMFTAAALGLVVQLYDIMPLLASRDITHDYFTMNMELWNSALEKFNKIVVFPPYSVAISKGDDYVGFVYLAGTRNIPVNTGYMLRPQKIDQQYVNRIGYELYTGNADKDAFYVLTDEYANKFHNSLRSNFNCYLLEGYNVFTAKGRPLPQQFEKYRVLE